LNMAAAAAPADIAARARRVSRRGARGGAARRGVAGRADRFRRRPRARAG